MKNIIFALFFVLIFTNFSYADISIDDMGFLLDEESSAGSSEEKIDTDDQYQSSEIDTAKRKGEDLSKSSAVSENLGLIIIGSVCGLFFLAVLYLFYLKTKKLADEAQMSKDLAEKYYFNTKEHFENHEEIRDDLKSNLNIIDKRIDIRLSLKMKELEKKVNAIIKDTFEKIQKEKRDDSKEQELIRQKNNNFVFGKEISKQDSAIDESKIDMDDDISDIITTVEKVFDQSKKKTKISDNDSLNQYLFTSENTNNDETNLDKFGKTDSNSDTITGDKSPINYKLQKNSDGKQNFNESKNELSSLGSLLTDDDVDKDKNADVNLKENTLGESSKDDQKNDESYDTCGTILDAKSLEDLKAAEFAVLNNINNDNASEKMMAEEEKNRKQIIDIITTSNNRNLG